MIKKFHANQARLRRHQRIRRRLEGSQARPRLCVFRSGQHIYAQVIDDTTGTTLVAASSLDESLRAFIPPQAEQSAASTQDSSLLGRVADIVQSVAEAAADALPTRGKGARTEKAASPAKGGKPGQAAQVKMVLPAAQKGVAKTPVEALAPIANNRKVATAREVGKLVAQRAREKGISRVVFDRGGYAYHGRIAALAEGAREIGLEF